MNKFTGIGRLTADPELRTTISGITVATFTLAVKRTYKNKNGEYDADFLRCVAYKRTAEILGQYTRKGSQIGVEGWVQTRSYEDKDGKRQYMTEIVVDRIHLLDPIRNDNQQLSDTALNDDNNEDIITEDDLPF